MRIWIDLANSPHPLLFAPVGRRLRERGHELVLTARDNAQTVELAREHWPEVEVIGGESPAGRAAKAATLARRIEGLRRWAHAVAPDLALSHGSYAQIVAARALGVPAVTAMDYEYQPANHLAFRAATTIIMPQALPAAAVRRQGARRAKIVSFPGLKEHIQLLDFEPDEGVLDQLGLPGRNGHAKGGGQAAGETRLVVFRAPPARAIYHREENTLFLPLLERICARPGTWCVVLARHAEQREQLNGLGLSRLVVPEHAVDSRSLMYFSDAMVGAGGTMTREAALLGTRTFSIFGGRRPYVDVWLEREGRLRFLTGADQFPAELGHAPPPAESLARLRAEGERALEGFVEAVAGGLRRSRAGCSRSWAAA